MKTFGKVLFGTALLLTAAVAAGALDAPASAPARTAKVEIAPELESMLTDPYMITWEKDPRARGREPFQSVLHFVGSETRKVDEFTIPRTPSEESAFALKAESFVEEAAAALDLEDFKHAEQKIKTVTKMLAVKLNTRTAQDRMAALAGNLVAVEKSLGSVRARASLKKALEFAGRMQAYFENERHGEVVGLYADIQEMNNENGLQHPDVATTAAAILLKCDEINRRANVHMEFSQLELKIDAVSAFPGGRSFAIVNGEVMGEGDRVAPELAMASVTGNSVVFDYKGEQIALEMGQ